MTIPGNNPLAYEGISQTNPVQAIVAQRSPNSTDVNFQIDTMWVNTNSNTVWVLTSISSGAAVWTALATGAGASIVTITGDTGGAESPVAGNFNIKGTANQIQVTGSAGQETLVLVGPYTPATFTAHGVLVGEGITSIVALAVGTTGQVLIGATGADPAFGALGVNSGLTAHGVLLGEGNSAIAATAAGTTGQVLIGSSGNDPAFGALGLNSALTNHGVLLGQNNSAIIATAVGTNGQVLLGSTANDPAFATLTTTGGTITYTTGAAALNIDVATSFLAQVTVTLTSAQIKALRATPITVVAAPAAGKSIFFFGAQLKSIYGGTNAFTNPQNLAIRYQNGSGTIVSNTITGAGFLDQTANEYQIVGISASSTITADTVVEAQALVIHNTGGSEITGNAAGDNTIKVTVQYAVLTQ